MDPIRIVMLVIVAIFGLTEIVSPNKGARVTGVNESRSSSGAGVVVGILIVFVVVVLLLVGYFMINFMAMAG